MKIESNPLKSYRDFYSAFFVNILSFNFCYLFLRQSLILPKISRNVATLGHILVTFNIISSSDLAEVSCILGVLVAKNLFTMRDIHFKQSTHKSNVTFVLYVQSINNEGMCIVSSHAASCEGPLPEKISRSVWTMPVF